MAPMRNEARTKRSGALIEPGRNAREFTPLQ
jgi:hypothetical protein